MRRALLGSAAAWACASHLACEPMIEPQLLRGTIDWSSVQLPLVEVRAYGSNGLAASSPVDFDGVFLLALPPFDTYTIELGASSSPGLTLFPTGDPSFPQLAICEAGPLADLGLVYAVLGECLGPECLDAEQRLRTCQTNREQECPVLFRIADNCRRTQEQACQIPAEALMACQVEGGPCLPQQVALDDCLLRYDCGDSERLYADLCAEPCAQESITYANVCAPAPGHICEGYIGVAFPAIPISGALGCGPGPVRG